MRCVSWVASRSAAARSNEIIYVTYQGNRNPFIDHPEWVEAIW